MKYPVPRQLKPRILKLNIRRGQINFIFYSLFFVSFEEKDYFPVVSVGQLGFGCPQPPHARRGQISEHTLAPNGGYYLFSSRLQNGDVRTRGEEN